MAPAHHGKWYALPDLEAIIIPPDGIDSGTFATAVDVIATGGRTFSVMERRPKPNEASAIRIMMR